MAKPTWFDAALIGLTDSEVVALCERAADTGIVVAANFNAPGQVVVSGERAIARLRAIASGAGVKRFVELPVSGAFHSPLMQPAADRMQDLLRNARIEETPRVPVITNVSASPVDDPDILRLNLIKQITHSVRWTESMGALVNAGIERAVEVGPGSVARV